MKAATYQLVLQFPGNSSEALDAVIQLEENLIAFLGDSADVDGHDVGSGEANIFILTDEPLSTYGRCRELLASSKPPFANYKAAFRPLRGSEYTVLHPESSTVFKVL